MHVFVFDPSLGNEETAELKLLYYHPPSTPRDEQVKAVGFCEAVTNFVSTFTKDACESVHTQHGRQIFLQAEPGIWLALLASHVVPPASSKPATATPSVKADSQEQGQCEQLPASEEAVQDGALQALLRRIYAMLRMTCGPLASVRAQRGVDGMRALLGQVLPLVLKVVLTTLEEDSSRPDLLDAIDGMRFLPTDRQLYLRVQYLVNLVRTRHACVRHVLVMHADHLVWSSLTQDATRLLHSYLVCAIASPPPHPARAERLQLNTAVLPDEALALGIALVHRQLRAFANPPPAAGSFVCGASDALQDGRSAVRAPCVHVEAQPGFPPESPPTDEAESVRHRLAGEAGSEDGADGVGVDGVDGAQAAASAPVLNGSGSGSSTGNAEGAIGGPGSGNGEGGAPAFERFRLVVYQVQQAVVAMLVDENAAEWSLPMWYQQLAALLVPELQPISVMMAEQHARMQALEEPYRFVYFNRNNLAVKSSLQRGSGSSRSGGANRLGLGGELQALVDRLHFDLAGGGPVREVALHTGAHGWIVGRANASRGFYLFVDGREVSWSEVHQEVQALCAVHFSSIFLDG